MKLLYTTIIFIFLIAPSGVSQCIENSHSPFKDQSWLSCTESQNPIEERGQNHWLRYDLQYDYSIDSVFIWNYNVWSETGNGVKRISVDHSMNGIDWILNGEYAINKAPGSWKYNTPQALVLDIENARYLLITVLETWDPLASCAGIAELKINVDRISSLESIASETSVKLYPNPANDFISIVLNNELINSKVQIINSIGKIVHKEVFSSGEELRLDTSQLLPGFYYVNVEKGGKIISKKFVKMNGV